MSHPACAPREVDHVRECMLNEALQRDEMESISIDATMRCCMPVVGQVAPEATCNHRCVRVREARVGIARGQEI